MLLKNEIAQAQPKGTLKIGTDVVTPESSGKNFKNQHLCHLKYLFSVPKKIYQLMNIIQ
jgi:hypothetical protein